jgi:hypothetical protein
MLQKGQASFFRTLFFATGIAALALSGFAQVTTTGIHGIVRDPSGAVVPSATVRVTDTGTGIERVTTSAQDGGFVFPDLQAATYKLSVSATGFQTAVYDSVVVDTGRTTDVPVQLTVGAATQTVEVSAVGAQLETTSNEVGTTINNKNIENLPYSSRDSLNFSLLMAGAQAGSGGSTFNNLPNASMSITIDGMDNNSERFKSGGTSFYAFAPERIDAIEETTVSTTGLGADASGMGAMGIRFTTRRGTDQFHGTVGEQFANEDLNANTFFANLRAQPISKTRQNNPYGRISGPLLPFVPRLKHKLFFMAYFEAQPQPGTTTLTTPVLSSASQTGNFTYIGTDGVTRTVNLLTAAGAAGYASTIDPTISSILGVINGTQSKASGFLPVTGQPYWQTMEWTQGTNTNQLFPAARVDFQITPRVAWHGSWTLRYENIHGSAPPYPGLDQYAFTNAYKITTYVGANTVDYTIKPNMINTTMFGVQSNGEYFYQGSFPQEWAPYGNRRLSIPTAGDANIAGGAAPTLIATPIPSSGNVLPFIRNNPVYQFKDDLNWVKGKHTFLIGGTVKHSSFYETSYGTAGVPVYSIGLTSSDPAAAALTAALPAINNSNGDLTNAEDLYAILTGRVTGISASNNVSETTHQYAEFQPATQRFAYTYAGLYIQDSFRVSPNFTLNYGFRWELDGAIHSTNGIDGTPGPGSFFGPSTGLFQPGSLNGNQSPTLVQATGSPYKSDLVNPAPTIGFAWNPSASGMLGKLLGDKKTVIRGGYSITYYNEGMNAISNVVSGNKGATQSISGTAAVGSTTFPIGTTLGSPVPPLTVTPATWGYPINESNYSLNSSLTLYQVNPNLVSPYVQNWNLGIQREVAAHTVLEVRYIGNKTTHMWHYQNINEVNVFENGFLPQFVQAQQNLSINAANGKGNTFVNNGLAGQAAMPIFDAAFGASGTNAALASSSGYGSSSFITDLQQGLAGTMASSLASTSSPTYFCRLVGAKFAPCASQGYTGATPYPVNFFEANPYASGGLEYQDSNGNSNYNGFQAEVRKAFSHGLAFTGNFVWSHSMGDELNSSDQTATYQWFTQRNGHLSYGPSPFDHRLAWNSFWTYDLPLGKGRALNIANPVIDRAIGGWTLGGVEQIATGSPSIISSGRDTVNQLAQSGVVFGNGLTLNQLQKDLATIPNMNQVVSGNLVSNVSGIVQSSGIANPADYAPASTPGVFSDLVYLYGKTTFTLNMSLNKQVRIKERWNVGFRMEALNFLNHPFFTSLGSSSVTANSFGQVSSASGNRSVLFRAYVSW